MRLMQTYVSNGLPTTLRYAYLRPVMPFFSDIWVPMNITAIANFLSHEVQRLRRSEQPEVQQAAMVAEQDLHLLQRVLNVDIGKWHDLAKVQAMMHQRFRDGLQERLGQYERAP